MKRQVDAWHWPLLFALAAIVTVFGAAGTALQAWTAAPAHIAPPQPVEDATAHAVRCPYCAWIESKRELGPGTYEYTARKADGSGSVFQEALPTTWRVGERLILIDGTAGEK